MTKAITLNKMPLTALIEAAEMTKASLTNNIEQLGAVLNEIGERFGAEGIDLACDKLDISRLLAGRLVAVHKGVLNPELALGTIPFSNRLERLPKQDQDAILKTGIELTRREGKTFRTKKFPITDLSRAQIAQIFDGDNIRSARQQMIYIKEQADKIPAVARSNKPPYEVKNGYLVVHRPTSIRKSDVLKLLVELG